jgi:hypothetical protein
VQPDIPNASLNKHSAPNGSVTIFKITPAPSKKKKNFSIFQAWLFNKKPMHIDIVGSRSVP